MDVQGLRDGDEVWIARPCVAARTEREGEEFLKALVPVITASPAYKDGGLIAI